MALPGHNDPCPCGSGRKFKHCCLRALDAENAARTRLRTAEGVLVPALFAYALRNRTPRQAAKTARGRERLTAILADFARTGERSPSAAGPDVEALRRRLGLD